MTDLLGPADAPNATTSRPVENRTIGNLDTWFRDCTTPAAADGTVITARELNVQIAQLRSAIRGNGSTVGAVKIVTEDNTDDAMLLKAMQQLIQRGRPLYATAGGAANAITISPTPALAEYLDGEKLTVTFTANNTNACTINVSGLGVLPLTRTDGAALQPNDIVTGMRGVIVCAATTGWQLQSLSPSRLAVAATSQPVYPEITSAGNAFTFTSPSGSLTINNALTWQHRGLNNYVTTGRSDLTFATLASKTYHLFWDAPGTGGASPATSAPAGVFTLFDRTSASPVETDVSYDSTYDRMLVAKVITDASNVLTVIPLINRVFLSASLTDSASGATTSVASGAVQPGFNASPRIIWDTRAAGSGGDGAGRCASRWTYNWARTPSVAPTSGNVGYTGISGTRVDAGTWQEGGSQITLKTVTRYRTDINFQTDYNLGGVTSSGGSLILTGSFAASTLDISANG